MNDKIIIFDTTLRDGEQTPSVSMLTGDKIAIASTLLKLNVDIVEVGFPASSEKDFLASRALADFLKNTDTVVAALARLKEDDIKSAYNAIKHAKNKRLHLFIATSDIHLKYKLKIDRFELLNLIKEKISYAKGLCSDIEFSLEDATRTDIDFLLKVVETAIESGANTINIPDTVGCALPSDYGDMIKLVVEQANGRAIISAHCHNDLGLAVANSLSALLNGARQVECTLAGIGERAGNAAMEEIVMNLKSHLGKFQLDTEIVTEEFRSSAEMLYEIIGIKIPPNKPIIGDNVFAHESGIHQDGVIKNPETYEFLDPKKVGFSGTKLIFGTHSGRSALRAFLKDMELQLSEEHMNNVLSRIKDVANKKDGEISKRDLKTIIIDEIKQVNERYKLDYLLTNSGRNIISTATIRLLDNGEPITKIGSGIGAIDAVMQTIKSMVNLDHTLLDFQVHSVTGGTDALAEVGVKMLRSCDQSIFTGRGISTDVIEASALAYLQGINKMLDENYNQ